MATAEPLPIYEELLDLLADTTDVDRLLAFRLSKQRQARLDELLHEIATGCSQNPNAENWTSSNGWNTSAAC